MKQQSIALVGGGNMARAIIGGLLKRGVRPSDIRVGEVDESARASLSRDFNIIVSAENSEAAKGVQILVVAVKPQDVEKAVTPLAVELRSNRATVLSVAAGIRTTALETWCGSGVSVVRAMPNRPALVGAGMTALYAGAGVSQAARELAESVMQAVGDVLWVEKEPQLDIVTAVSGSGPAYFFLLAEGMSQAAVDLGLRPDVARKLAIGTLHGSGLLARESAGDLARMRAEVTSKGGTTEAAVRALEAADFRKIIARAIEAATARSQELGR